MDLNFLMDHINPVILGICLLVGYVNQDRDTGDQKQVYPTCRSYDGDYYCNPHKHEQRH